jgi:Ca-activated chloride channel family protein
MRSRIAALVVAAPLATLGAQGRILPRPCLVPVPQCDAGRCRPTLPPPCPGAGTVERTSSVARVELADRVLRWEIDETFVNRGARLAEADYLFPLPKGAAFEDLKLEIDGELVAGETMSADRARGVYEEIVRRQRDPALVEWVGSGLLRARIFPLEPGRERRVVVRFQSVAEREGDALRVDFARPRDPGEGGAGMSVARPVRRDDAARRDDSRESGAALTLTLPRDDRYGAPFSPTHRLRAREKSGRRVVTAEGAGDVTILVPLRRAERAAVSVLTHRALDDEGFALITVTPPASAPRRVPRDVTFVLDVSGSMRGEKMEQARAAGRELLTSLDEGDRFRLIDFATDVRAFREGWTTATREHLAEARRYLDGLQAEGSTNISGALEEALDTPATPGRLALTLFITDGAPTIGERDPESIAALASRLRGERRIFTFGLGADVNAALVERLAVEGRGTASFVRPDESVERAVSVVASRLGTPIVTDARIRVEGSGVRIERVMPSLAQDIFAGQDLVVLARYTGSGTARVSVEGMTAGGPVVWRTEARFPDRERQNPFVARLWATQRVGWLSAERRRSGPSAELDAELRELGTRYGIPTELTSYLVTEPGMDVARGVPTPTRRRLGDVAPQLNAVVATGATADTKAAAPVSAESRFEAAKAAAARREARTLADADAATATGSRRAGDRIFAMRDGVWTDGRDSSAMRVVRVKAYSRAWFELVRRVPTLREALALGERVRVTGRTIVVETGVDGVETMSDAEIAAVEREW